MTAEQRGATWILIVEDDEVTGPSLNRIMTGAGYDSWEAPSLADANGGNGAVHNGRSFEMRPSVTRRLYPLVPTRSLSRSLTPSSAGAS